MILYLYAAGMVLTPASQMVRKDWKGVERKFNVIFWTGLMWPAFLVFLYMKRGKANDETK